MHQKISTFLAEKNISFRHENHVLDAMLTEATLKLENNRLVEVLISLQVDFEKYTFIDSQAIFHLDDDKKTQGSDYDFDKKTPILLDLILDNTFLEKIDSYEAKDFIHLLVQENKNSPTNQLLNFQSWYVLHVKQEVEVPAQIAEDGILKMGYATTWYESKFAKKLPTSTLFRDIFNFYKAAFPYCEVIEANKSFGFAFQNQEYTWNCLVVVREQYKQVLFYSFVPYPVLDKEIILKKITELNYDLPVGNFEMEWESGQVRFKTYLDFDQQQLNAQMLQTLFEANIYSMNKFLPQLEVFSKN